MYLLFAGESYYPGGGADDFVGIFETEDAAKLHYELNDSSTQRWAERWAHIAEIRDGTLKIVWEWWGTDKRPIEWKRPA